MIIPPRRRLLGKSQFTTAFHQAFPDFTLSVDEEIAEGDTTSYCWNCATTYTGESALLPVPPTGTATTATGGHFIHGHNGQSVEVWSVPDFIDNDLGCQVGEFSES